MEKQFLMIVNEPWKLVLQQLFNSASIDFLEVQGMNLNAENKLNILVTPVHPPVTPANVEAPEVATGENHE